jgi:hypothetical protein
MPKPAAVRSRAPKWKRCRSSNGTIAGAIDGTNRRFTLPTKPVNDHEEVKINGLMQDDGPLVEGGDYQMDGQDILFHEGQQPQPGDTLACGYWQ